jgi:hypothetical protein
VPVSFTSTADPSRKAGDSALRKIKIKKMRLRRKIKIKASIKKASPRQVV